MILPPYGLSGGSMRFDPSSLVLYTTDSLDSIQSILDQSASNSIKSTQIRSRLIHERDHLFRHLSSSYGFVRFGLHSLMLRLFYEMLKLYKPNQSMTDSGLIPPELKLLLTRSPSVEMLQRMTQVQTLRPFLTYLSCLECIHALDGDDAFLDRDLALGAIKVWESIAQASSGQMSASSFQPSAIPPSKLSAYLNPDDPLVPQHQGKTIGAAALLEFFGIMMEFAYLSNQGLHLIDSSDLHGQASYFLISSLFFGEFFTQEFASGNFPAFPVELEAAVDLALCIPMSHLGMVGTNQPMTWFDIHPGWRFLQICMHYQETKKTWTRIPPDDDSFTQYDLAFSRIQTEVCLALGWPPATEVESSWRIFLRDLKTRESLHPFAWDLRGSGRLQIASHLLGERLSQPYSMYLKRRSGVIDKELFFPGVISPEGMSSFNGIHWKGTDGQPTNWDELLMFTGCRFFAEGYSGHPHFRRDCAIGSAELICRCSRLFAVSQDQVEATLAEYLNLDSYHRFEKIMTRSQT